MTPELKRATPTIESQNKIFGFIERYRSWCRSVVFSNNVVQIQCSRSALQTVDVLETTEIQSEIQREYSNWPTIPQVYINLVNLAARTF